MELMVIIGMQFGFVVEEDVVLLSGCLAVERWPLCVFEFQKKM
jgi:hypothetical protein